MSDERFRIAVGLAALLFTLACGGSGGGGDGDMFDAPPANVAGVWNISSTNPGAARYTNCTGDLTVLNGLTVAGVVASGPACQASGPAVVTQHGSSFTIEPVAYACSDGSRGTYAGGGSISGSSLTGQLDVISNQGWSGSELFRGGVSGGSISLDSYRVRYSGVLTGSCSLSPELSYSGTIAAGKGGGFRSLDLVPVIHRQLTQLSP